MANNRHCDDTRCSNPVHGVYKLTEYDYPPSQLCRNHGDAFIRDARENRIKFSVKTLEKAA